MASISDLLIARGQYEADSRRQRAGNWIPLVQHLSNLPNQIMADRAADGAARESAFDRAQQRDVRSQQLAKGDQELAAGTRAQAQAEATETQKRQMNELLATPGVIGEDGRFDVQGAQRIATEKGYRDILDDVLAFGQDWNEGVDKGLLTKAQIDEAKRPKVTQTDPTKDTYTDGVMTKAGVPETKPFTFGALDKVMVNGKTVLVRPRSDGALVDLKGNVVKDADPEPQMSQQERSGYFTMTPIYDQQGRPIGAMKLNARTGETTLVKPEDMGGGVTARPPGNLGQRTVENEAALDSLDRLKDMFDKGAKDDIGPAEGRARSIGQKVPGGMMVTERFANFEAATRAFQNAMIKAITGAQMSEPEAKRIMGQIPNVNDNPTVWKAKYDQSVKNMEDLEKRTRTDRGAPVDDTDALLDELLGGGR